MMDDRRLQLTQFFVNKGLEPHQAAGIVGNLEGESNLDPRAVGDHGTSGGLAQWHNERLSGLNKFAFNNNADANDVNTQAEYLWHELNTTHKKALEALRQSKSTTDATIAFTDHFERPAKPNYEHRAGLAERALNLLIPEANAAEPIYADTVEQARAAKAANPNAQVFIREDAYQTSSDYDEAKKIIEKYNNPETSKVEAFSHGAANWGLGGFADEGIGAGIALVDTLMGNNGHLSFEQKYKLARDTVRDRSDTAYDEHAGAYGTGAVVGAVGSPLNKLGVGAAAAKQGALLGSIYGAGNADELADVPLDALTGAGLGAVGGKAIETGGKILGAVSDAGKIMGKGLTNGNSALLQQAADHGVGLTRENTLGAGLGKFVGQNTDGLPLSPINRSRQTQLSQVKNRANELADTFKPTIPSKDAYTQLGSKIDNLDPTVATAGIANLKNTASSLLPQQGSIEGLTLPATSQRLLKGISNLDDSSSINNLLDMRKTINRDIGDIMKTKIRDTGDAKSLNVLWQLKNSIDNDIESWAQNASDDAVKAVKTDIADSLKFANKNHIAELKNNALTEAISKSERDGVFNYKLFRKNIDKVGNTDLFKDPNELDALMGLAKLTEHLKQPLNNTDSDIWKILGVGGIAGEPISSTIGSYMASWLVSRPAVNKSLVNLAHANTPKQVNTSVRNVINNILLHAQQANTLANDRKKLASP
ncbi:phage tail tip lysozyme [Methylobacter sp. YRD-M1]|uniref:phage tail tip lysozyme n=1 Tax=Methylobacter sp. YRD-M1 TaxID=2911520 RepID=UPI00227A09D7|nr:phage tail tip lysozyme [Methylobacter sp. YRD-M1]WAK01880.1 phage tail tip lysozyme [Methylobacter sp. YRD-M1]